MSQIRFASNDSEAETDSLSTVGQPSPERLRKLRSVEVMRGFTVKEHNPSVHTRAFFAFFVNLVWAGRSTLLALALAVTSAMLPLTFAFGIGPTPGWLYWHSPGSVVLVLELQNSTDSTRFSISWSYSAGPTTFDHEAATPLASDAQSAE
jgi:hypothetical protein